MGKKLSVARSEEEGQPVLLARTSNGKFVPVSGGRNKRSQKSSTAKRSPRGKAEITKAKSKSSRNLKRVDASTPETDRCGQGNNDRQSDRGNERKDTSTWRSSQELEIVHPGSYCDDADITPHYWVSAETVYQGTMFQCRHCHRHIWLHTSWAYAEWLAELIKRYGKTEGYCIYLNKFRAAKILIAKMQDLRRMEIEAVDKVAFAKTVDEILKVKDYDSREAE